MGASLNEKKACRVAVYRDTDVEKFDSDPDLVEGPSQTITRFANIMRPRISAL